MVQLQLYNEEIDLQAARQVRRLHRWLLRVAMVVVALLAAVAFAVGCWKAAVALSA